MSCNSILHIKAVLFWPCKTLMTIYAISLRQYNHVRNLMPLELLYVKNVELEIFFGAYQNKAHIYAVGNLI